jgi:NhaA family Na+:H+ antiporter
MTAGGGQTRSREQAAGLLLIAAATVAIGLANSPLAANWHHLLDYPLGVRLPRLGMLTPHSLVADGLMAIFFLLVGLELKREYYEGRLASPAERRLPILAAAAGMAVPALVYLIIVQFNPDLQRGWAISSATDIAFAIGVLALLGPRVPPAIKVLLVTIAVVDDLGAVLVIAIAYTQELNIPSLATAAGVTAVMVLLARFGVRKLSPFLIGFALLWLLVLVSGVHPTIAGVAAALTIPLGRGESHSPLKHLEHRLHPWVMFAVVPLFGLVSAGVAVTGGIAALAAPVPLGIMLGLFIGKQAGIFGTIRLAVALGLAVKPAGASWRQVYGASILCGIGFTMSMFIGGLAWPQDPSLIDSAKLGTLAGSLISGLFGFVVLRLAPVGIASEEDQDDADEIFAADMDEEVATGSR